MTDWELETDITLGPDYSDYYTLMGFTISPLLTNLKIDDLRFKGGINTEYKTEVTGVPGKRFNFYHNVFGFAFYNDIYRDRGLYIRGVRDSTMNGTSGVFQQNSFGINVVHWKGVLNLQIHPFFDYGYTWGGTAGTSDEFRYGFGADILFFVDKVSNLTLCATIGFDPTRNFTEEIIIGTGYSY